MLVAGDHLFVTYLGKGEGEQVFVRDLGEHGEGGTPATMVAGRGLPEPGHDKSGVVRLAADGGTVYALLQDYNAGGSTVTAYQFTGN